jgi:hypothetical protein
MEYVTSVDTSLCNWTSFTEHQAVTSVFTDELLSLGED